MKKQNMKKGITLIEIILAIVLIAIIMGITIPKLMSNSTRAEIKQTVTSDLRSIVEAATTWKRASSEAGGNYINITSGRLNTRLPSNMQVDETEGLIYSSGLRTGNNGGTGNNFQLTGPVYTVMWQFDPVANTDTGRFSIGVDFTYGRDVLDCDPKILGYARDVFNDTIVEITGAGNVSHGASVQTKLRNGTDSAVAFDCANSTDFVCIGNLRVR